MDNTSNSDSDTTGNANPEILYSDPQQRRKVRWLIAAMAATALLFWLFALPALKHWVDARDVKVMTQRMGLVYYCLSLLLLVTGTYAAWYARRILYASQFPPPGSWVLRDTRLLHGDQARARGWWVVACAVSLMLIAAYIAVLPPRIDALLIDPGVQHSAILAGQHG
jgi:hypothetical protein